jgi:hypothetical protein
MRLRMPAQEARLADPGQARIRASNAQGWPLALGAEAIITPSVGCAGAL